jgi:hypothetical protein
MHYKWVEADDEDAKAFEDRQEEFRDSIRDEIRRRAIDSWDEPLYRRRG